jgi:Fe2+ transport system protein FeoA
MRKTIFDGLSQALARHRLRLISRLITHNLRRLLMNLGFLDGFKTYLVAAAMMLAAISQLVGIDLPSFEGQAAGQLLMEGLAILFLRKGIKG